MNKSNLSKVIPVKGDRSQAIRQYLYVNGLSSVADISAAVGASPATLRRDLSLLESEGVAVRERGGARLADRVETEVAFDPREAEKIIAKRAIGARAFEGLTAGGTIFLESGTTVLQLARRIRMEPIPLIIFTNCLPVAQHLMGAPDVTVKLIGGTLRMENSSLVGPLAEAGGRGLRFDHLFLGAGALGHNGRISSLDDAEAQINRPMIARSSRTTLLADATKIGRQLTFEVGRCTDLHRIIANAALPEPLAQLSRDAGVEVDVVTAEQVADR